jgi:hypothetical protein
VTGEVTANSELHIGTKTWIPQFLRLHISTFSYSLESW